MIWHIPASKMASVTVRPALIMREEAPVRMPKYGEEMGKK